MQRSSHEKGFENARQDISNFPDAMYTFYYNYYNNIVIFTRTYISYIYLISLYKQ